MEPEPDSLTKPSAGTGSSPSALSPEKMESPSDPSAPLPAGSGTEKTKTLAVKSAKAPPPSPATQETPKKKPLLSGSELKRKEKFDKLNHKAFERIKNRQNVFNVRGRFSFLINVFSKEKEAVEYVQKLRGRFPLWGFFLKPDRQNLRVYLGPFLTKDRAGDFIKTLPDPKPFPNYFLEMEGL